MGGWSARNNFRILLREARFAEPIPQPFKIRSTQSSADILNVLQSNTRVLSQNVPYKFRGSLQAPCHPTSCCPIDQNGSGHWATPRGTSFIGLDGFLIASGDKRCAAKHIEIRPINELRIEPKRDLDLIVSFLTQTRLSQAT